MSDLQRPKTVKIGAGWKKQYNEENFISISLNNDAKAALWKNKNKTDEKHPDFILKMDWDAAEAMGLISQYDYDKYGNTDVKQDSEIDLDDIPFD